LRDHQCVGIAAAGLRQRQKSAAPHKNSNRDAPASPRKNGVHQRASCSEIVICRGTRRA
jgi:hypothetical protein